jgi:hypothetical protein
MVKEMGEFRDVNGHCRWICECECGNITAATAGNLQNGSTSSCGCLKAEKQLNDQVIDLTGEKYGRLTVVSRVVTGKPGVKWLCRCDCGKEKIVSTGSLRHSGTRSCGCLKREWSDKSALRLREYQIKKLPFGESQFNSLFKQYRAQAAQRGFDFSLKPEDCRKMFQSVCEYCGKEPSQIYRGSRSHGYYVYNGIDRKDPLKGYLLENCVAACKLCNYAKRNLPFDDWNEWMDRMVAWRSNVVS